jgi:hypothetical protein
LTGQIEKKREFNFHDTYKSIADIWGASFIEFGNNLFLIGGSK